MGFDNECILNIQSLPGEYFCPVCRTLIYPEEALQSQCTHLYCKPCLAYVVATTHACPYDGYLVTEADSKPLIESNKSLAETIGKVAVHCLYHRSGCQWQGTLSECTTHCTGCNFGNSPVVCNRCGTQIVHRQVQEHAQICPGLQPQAQQVENAQPQASAAPNQAAQDASSTATAAAVPAAATAAATTVASTSAAAAAAPAAAPAAGTTASAPAVGTTASAQGQVHGNAAVYPQTVAQAPTPEQWYQQQQLQYQQYYQQYPGYYQQQYQQYGQYQQQTHPQYVQPQMQVAPQQVIQGQQQPQPYMLPQPQPQPQPQLQPQPQTQPQVPQAQPQTQAQPLPQPQPAQPQMQQQHLHQQQPQQHPHAQPQPQLQTQLPAQPTQMQAQQLPAPAQQLHLQVQPQTHPPPHGQVAGQQLVQPHPLQPHHSHPQAHAQAQPPQLQAPPLHQQPIPPQHLHAQMQHPQPHPQYQPNPQHQPQTHPHPHPQPQLQQPQAPLQHHPQSRPQAQAHPQSIHQTQPQHLSAQAVTGFQSYPQPIPGAPQQHPMHMHPQQQRMPHPQTQNQFPPQQHPQMRPPHAQLPIQVQQQPAMPPQGPHTIHPVQQQAQRPVHQPGQQIQPHAQQGFPQAQGHFQPGQPPQQGALPPQHFMHPQQSLRPQGPAYIPGQPHPQMNAPPAQGLPNPQVQARPSVANQGILQQPLQQSPGGPPKLIQHVVNQQSLNQNYMGSSGRLTSSELQSASVQQSQLQHTGSQGNLLPASSASQLGPAAGATPKEVSVLDKVSQAPELEVEQNVKNVQGSGVSNSTHGHIEGAESAKLKIPEHEYVSNSMDSEEKSSSNVTDKEFDKDKKILESSQMLGEGLKPGDKNLDGPMAKDVKDDEATNAEDGAKNSDAPETVGGEIGIKGLEGKPDEKFGARIDGEDAKDSNKIQREPRGSNQERATKGFVSQSQIAGDIANVMQTPQQMPPTGSLDRGQLPQPISQNTLPAHERAFLQPGYHDRNISQFPRPHLGVDDRRGMLPTGPIPGQDRYPPEHASYGHPPNMPDPAMVSQRPPAPDRMFPQHMPSVIQERRFPEPPLHQMQVHGQSMAPSQMRPPGHNFPEPFPHQGQPSVAPESFQPPLARQPYGPHHSEVPHAGVPGPGLPPSSARVPGHLGFPQKSFEEQAMAPHGQSQSHLPPSHAGGARTSQAEPLARQVMGGAPPGVFDTSSGMMARGPPFLSEDKRLGVFDGRPLDPHRPLPTEHAVYGQPSIIHANAPKINGMPSNVPVGGMPGSAFAHGLPDDRFRPLPEERFKSLPEDGLKAAQDERFRPFPLDPGRHAVSRRDFEEDLKQFPRPVHLDGEGVPKFDAFVSSSRPLDRGPQQFGLDAVPRHLDRAPHGSDVGASALTPRALPPYQSGAPFPGRHGGPDNHLGFGERDKPIALKEHLGRKNDLPVAHPDHLRAVPEFERHRMDGLPPLRSPGLSTSPGHFIRGPPDGRGSLRMEHLGSGSILGANESLGNKGEAFGFDGFRSHTPGYLPPHLRTSDSGFSGSYPGHGLSNDPRHFNSSEMDAFEQSRKRKPGSVGWCRICKIDCETVESLDLHSQTREHQKMAMEMVLSIKQEIAMRRKLTSENAVSFEDTNRSRKASFENRGNRQ